MYPGFASSCRLFQFPDALSYLLICYSLLGAKMVIGVVVYGWAVDYYNAYHREYNKEQAKKGRQRHKSGEKYFFLIPIPHIRSTCFMAASLGFRMDF